MKERSLFLSRATSEFESLTDTIRTEGARAFSHVEIFDQKNPPGNPASGVADITVAKIHEWIRNSSYVFHYVGFETGGAARLPSQNEIDGLRKLLDMHSHRVLDSLVAEFREGGLNECDITYTQLEGVIAIALNREPLVFLLDSDKSEIAPSQRIYRNWLRKFYLQGRDRIASRLVDDLQTATFRVLARINRELMLEYLLRATRETPLWETIYTLAQPETSESDIEKKVKEIRDWTGVRDVDLVADSLSIVDGNAPESISKELLGLQTEEASPRWFVTSDNKLSQISIKSGRWIVRDYPISKSEVRAVCVHDRKCAVLVERAGKYFVLVLDDAVIECELKVRGFATHNFEHIRLLRSDGAYCLICVSCTWQLSERVENGIRYLWAKAQSSIGEASSGMIRQYSERSPFPLRRRFRGAIYDADFREKPTGIGESTHFTWAITRVEDRLECVTYRPADFLELFKTVDLALDGNWNAYEVESEGGIARLKLEVEESEGFAFVPLFPTKEIEVQWTKVPAELPLLVSKDSRNIHYAVLPKRRAKLEPFCFIERSIEKSDCSQLKTRIRVWLIPQRWNGNLIRQLKEFLCDANTAPVTPIRQLEGKIEAAFHDKWWDNLWNHCH